MRPADNLRGIGLMTGSMAAFAIEDMFLKFAAVSLPTGEVLALTACFGFLFFAVLAQRDGRSVISARALHPWILARNFGEMVGTYAFITALAAVPLPLVAAVLQAMPLAVTLAAALFLGEAVGWRRWSAIIAGFAGVLLVIQPGFDGFNAASLWVLVTVAGLALRDIASRMVPPDYSTTQVSAWGVASVLLLGLGMMAWQGAVVPDAWQSAMLAGATLVGTLGYWLITAAARTGEVAVVSPFRYTRLIFAIAIGGLVFHEYPDRWMLIGASVIIASGLYALARERARKRLLSKTGLAG